MRVSKFVKLDVDVLLEWIYDDDNFLAEPYRVTINTLEDTRAFSQKENINSVIETTTNNQTTKQLFSLDQTINKWGVVNPDPDTNRYLFLQFQDYAGNVPVRYDVVRLHFPINYNFQDKLGFLVNIGLMSKNQNKQFNISNYYYDKTDYERTKDISFTAPPFLFQEQLWGKYIEISVPAPYSLIRDFTEVNNNIVPRDGSLHKNLVDDDLDVLSLDSPIFIDFQFLTLNETKLNQEYYLTGEPFSTTLPVTPEFESLGVEIVNSDQGDFFEIYGTFNSNISEFNSFIRQSRQLGRNYIVEYEISIFEKNLLTGNPIKMLVDKNFDSPVEYRPIIKFSTTTATIDVTMRLINTRDNSSEIRRNTYSLLQDEVAKYSRSLTKINLSTSNKPKIYNSKPDQINVSIGKGLRNKEVVRVPYAVFFERYNILTKNKTEQINDTIYYGIGENQILLYPSDNVVKFVIAKGTDENGIMPLELRSETPVFLQFKSNSKVIDVPLFTDGDEVDLSQGIVVFRILEEQLATIVEINEQGFNQFYITTKSENGVNTIVYAGTFLLYNS